MSQFSMAPPSSIPTYGYQGPSKKIEIPNGKIIPLHLPPGDPSLERTVQIDGTNDQIEAAKQLVIKVTSGEGLEDTLTAMVMPEEVITRTLDPDSATVSMDGLTKAWMQ